MPEPEAPKDPIRIADVAAILVLGIALGVLFNALQLADDPARALAWVKAERAVVSLGGEAEAATPPPAAAATPAAATPAAAPADKGRAQAKPVRPHPPAAGAKPATAKPATAKPAAPAAATKAAAATGGSSSPSQLPGTAPAPETGSPAIPDARDPREAGIETVRALYAAGTAVFLDARSREDYEAGHVAGAISLPFDDVFKDPAKAKAYAAPGRVLVCYCDGGDCDLSRNLAFSLIDAGARKVLVFKDGLPAWKSAGAPVRTGSQP